MLNTIMNISFSLIVSAGQEISGLASWFWFSISQEIAFQCQPGLQSSEGFSGAGGAASKVPLSYDWQVGAGCWWKPSVPFPVGLATGLLEHPHNMAAGFP